MKCLATQDTFKEDFFCIRLVDDSGSTHDALVTQNAITFKSICFTCFFSRRVLMRQELSCAKESDGVAENDQEKINTHTHQTKKTLTVGVKSICSYNHASHLLRHRKLCLHN